MTDFLDKLTVSLGGEPYTFQQLAANNFIVSEETVAFEAPGVEGFSMHQLYSGHTVVELPVTPLKNRPGFKASLLRGRNIFRVDPAGVEFSLFYKSALRDWIESILKAFVILLVIQTFVVQTFFIPTGSMKNTLYPGDYIMVEKLTYRLQDPDPGEIIVFEYPDDVSKDFIKRLIAKGNDSLVVQGGTVSRNGRKMKEPYTVYRKRLLSREILELPAGFGYDMQGPPEWQPAKGAKHSWVIPVSKRLDRIKDLDVDSIEQLEVSRKDGSQKEHALARKETVAEVDASPGSYMFDRKALEVTIHPRMSDSLANVAGSVFLYFRFVHEDSQEYEEIERDVMAETASFEDKPMELPPDELWAMGDNRNNSADSRFWRNPLRRRGLMGKGLLVYWPPWHIGMIRHLHLDRDAPAK